MLRIRKENYLFHLSYDITVTNESKEELENKNLQLKRDLVWEILIIDEDLFLYNPVASTIVFESSNNFEYWVNKFNNYSDTMVFAFSEVADHAIEENRKEMKLILHPNEGLHSNFIERVVDYEKKNMESIRRTGRKLSSRRP